MKTAEIRHDSGIEIKKLPDLSNALIQLRQARNLEQSDMKMLIGMSQQQYQSIEAGSNTTINTLLRILEGLEVDLILMPKNSSTTVGQSWFDGVKKFFDESESAPTTPTSKISRDLAHLRDDE